MELRGYAPQISGIAYTNATVTINASGCVIYQKKTHQADLSIDHLNQSVQGTPDKQRKDGRVKNFQVLAASMPFLTRQGQVPTQTGRGSATALHVTTSNENETFFSNEVSWDAVKHLAVRQPAAFW